jgi:hypothetical protein
MENKFKIIETEEYTLAVSDEEIKKGDYNLTNGVEVFNQSDVKEFTLEYANRYWQKAVAYQPKGNAPELELPLLPEIVIEDVENLTRTAMNKWVGNLSKMGYSAEDIDKITEEHSFHYLEGYKSATKRFSEEDLRKAIEIARDMKYITYSEDEIISTVNQTKTPKWFVAEKEYLSNTGEWKPVLLPSEWEIDTQIRLKTTTINGKTYLIGYYEK